MKSTNNKNNMQIVNNEPTKPQRIACRICEQIFSTPQTLISHIESTHMKNDLSTLPSPSRKPFPLNLQSFSSSSAAPNYPNPYHHQNLCNFPMRKYIDLNHYRNQYYNNYGRFQNGFIAGAGAPPQPANFRFGPQLPPQQMQLFPVYPTTATAMARVAGDCTLPLLHQLEQRKSSEVSVPYIKRSVSNSIDLTLKL